MGKKRSRTYGSQEKGIPDIAKSLKRKRKAGSEETPKLLPVSYDDWPQFPQNITRESVSEIKKWLAGLVEIGKKPEEIQKLPPHIQELCLRMTSRKGKPDFKTIQHISADSKYVDESIKSLGEEKFYKAEFRWLRKDKIYDLSTYLLLLLFNKKLKGKKYYPNNDEVTNSINELSRRYLKLADIYKKKLSRPE